MTFKNFLIFSLLFLPLFSLANPADDTAKYFETIKHDPTQLRLFIADMPKGGELHNHLSGATYAENVIAYAKNDGWCVNASDYTLSKNPHCHVQYLLKNVTQNFGFYTQLINAWSIRYYVPNSTIPRPNQFFDSFEKALPAVDAHIGEILAEVVGRAAEEKENYLELMILAQTGRELQLGSQLKFNKDFDVMRRNLLQANIQQIVTDMKTDISTWERIKNKKLACAKNPQSAECSLQVRYIFTGLRTFSPTQVFAQLLAGFMLADQDPRVVGVNFVAPEHNPIALRDYRLHMDMFNYLHKLYPNVKISLHAGELTSGLVPPEDLRDHINLAVNVGHASRIGHGADISYEDNHEALLKQMAQNGIALEESLTSNAMLLNLQGKQNPFPLYLRYRVPVVLNTDDEGVLRIDLNHEYQYAVENYDLTYPQLKQLTRNALTYSFLPGLSLWQDAEKALVVSACQVDSLGNQEPSKMCAAFLAANEKARMQWRLEGKLAAFEKQPQAF